MSSLEKHVHIRLRTLIDDAGDVEETKVQATGRFFQKGKIHVLTFKEQIEDQHPVHNFITIQDDQASIKRSGMIEMQQKFKKQQVTENVYQHPHGNMHMETFTDTYFYTPLSEGEDGKLVLTYTLKLNGQNERKHRLELQFSEEDPHEHS